MSQRDVETDQDDRRGTWQLRAMKFVFAGCLLLTFAGRDRDGAWPFLPWTMYAGSKADPPPTSADRMEVRIVDVDGHHATFTAAELLPVENLKHADGTLRWAARELGSDRVSSTSEYMANLSRRANRGVAPAAIEIWRLTFDVDPFVTPALDRTSPRSAECVARLDVTPQVLRRRQAW